MKNQEIYYERYGSGDTLIFLHGWGQNTEMMLPVAKPFIKNHDVILIDLPGFGKSKELDEPLAVMDYVETLHNFIINLNLKNVTLIGHSFGGKVSLLYASKYQVKKLVLFASPFKKEIENESLKLKALRTLKKIPGINKLEGFAKKHIGSTDYKNASPVLRETLVKTVNLDITEDVKKITCPTLIIWGDCDEAVDVKRGHELENLIKDSGLIVYNGLSHYAYLEDLNRTIKILDSFLN